MKTLFSSRTHYINGTLQTAPLLLARQLKKLLSGHDLPTAPPIFVCIGSDRVTGDSLGPLVGTSLAHSPYFPYSVYGTLRHPVHALNLGTAVCEIQQRHPHNPVIAIDASLGSRHHQRYITIAPGSIAPGSGVDKELPAIGDIAITGIINTMGDYPQMLLQTTRLSVVMELANCITHGILLASGCLDETECAVHYRQ
ncbi:MAG: spore protease YyaC [Eubacteriales bacterium]|nr:spore protease YyaC [Eubacteriales bacterium]